MVSRAVCNTGPLIHLAEVSLVNALLVVSEVFISDEVRIELYRNKVQIDLKNIKMQPLRREYKDAANIFVNKFSLDLGEAQSIALCLQEKPDYFLTDDLDARTVAAAHSIEVHGTIGIVLRAFRQKIIGKEAAVKKIRELHSVSSLFITKDLVEQAVRAINEYKKRSE
ncbi:hypothetical protein HYX10_00380 [Candidatus Woesearchaeota archaeon]|nr:hypothetical protein [Candidatus Woesearchaeota archaeon]